MAYDLARQTWLKAGQAAADSVGRVALPVEAITVTVTAVDLIRRRAFREGGASATCGLNSSTEAELGSTSSWRGRVMTTIIWRSKATAVWTKPIRSAYAAFTVGPTEPKA